MPFDHPKINQLEGGWYIVYKNNSVVTETDMPWIKVPNKIDIKIMGLKWRNKLFELEGEYTFIPPGETHMRELSISSGEGVQVTKESRVGRFIGYYDVDGKTVIRLDISSGKFITEKVPY